MRGGTRPLSRRATERRIRRLRRTRRLRQRRGRKQRGGAAEDINTWLLEIKEVVENLRVEKATGATTMNFGSIAGHPLPIVDPTDPDGNVAFTFTMEDGMPFDAAGIGGAELREGLLGALGPEGRGIDIKTISPEQFRDAMSNNAAPETVEFMNRVETALRNRVDAPVLGSEPSPIVEAANYPLYIWAVIVNNNTELFAPMLESPNATPRPPALPTE